MCINNDIGCARNRTFDDVADGKYFCTSIARHMEGGQRICGFTGLRYRDKKRLFGYYWLAISELAGQVNRYRYPTDTFYPVFPDKGGVPRCATRHDINVVECELAIFPQRLKLAKDYLAGTRCDTSSERVFKYLRLFKYLLQHEMLVSALFSRYRIPRYNLVGFFNRIAVHILYEKSVRGKFCYLAVFQKNHLARVWQQRRYVRGHEVFPVAAPTSARPCLF